MNASCSAWISRKRLRGLPTAAGIWYNKFIIKKQVKNEQTHTHKPEKNSHSNFVLKRLKGAATVIVPDISDWDRLFHLVEHFSTKCDNKSLYGCLVLHFMVVCFVSGAFVCLGHFVCTCSESPNLVLLLSGCCWVENVIHNFHHKMARQLNSPLKNPR